MFNRYKEPAIMPQIPGKMDLFQDDSKSYKNGNRENFIYHRKMDLLYKKSCTDTYMWYCLPGDLQDI